LQKTLVVETQEAVTLAPHKFTISLVIILSVASSKRNAAEIVRTERGYWRLKDGTTREGYPRLQKTLVVETQEEVT
jgi:hypothetical protein